MRNSSIFMRRAIVLGGSIAGLLAARVLSEYAEEVVIIERDRIDQVGDQPRAGVPQGNQLHVLLDAGRLQLERWFPGFTMEAVASGAHLTPLHGSGIRFRNGKSLPAPSKRMPPALLATRPYLELLVRNRVFAFTNITFVPGRAQDLVFSRDRVLGVQYVTEDLERTQVMTGNFVVDAMGRSSRVGEWLTRAGWNPPPMQRMNIKINYCSLMFSGEDRFGAVQFVASKVEVPEEVHNVAVVMAVEGGRHLMLQIGCVADRFMNVESYIEHARIHPSVFTAIATESPSVGRIAKFHLADTRRRDYHKLRRFPGGLVAAGDAVASFNPVHGQGMACAALHASALSEYLSSSPSLTRPAALYFKRVKGITNTAWRTSSFSDLELPHVHGQYPSWYRIRKWYDELVSAAAATDPIIAERLGSVNALSTPHNALMRPRTLGRVFALAAARALKVESE